MNDAKIQSLHTQAESHRENAKYKDALQAYEVVKNYYQKSGNYPKLIEAMCGECLTYKHLYLTSGDAKFLLYAKKIAISSMQIANSHKLGMSIYQIHFLLGEIEMLFENYDEAINHFQIAVKMYPQDTSEKGRYLYHLGEAQFKNGQKETGINNILQGIEIIEKNEDQTESFLINVWLTGAYTSLANILWEKDKGKAQAYLAKAEEIIKSDNRLIIRKRQLQELKRKLSINKSSHV